MKMFSYNKSVNCIIVIFFVNLTKICGSGLAVWPSERLKTVTLNSSYFVEGSLYVFEMITKQAVNECVNLCKAKKKCKFINFYHPANICYLIGVIGNTNILKENYLDTDPGFLFGAKEDWNIGEFAECEGCNNYGVCNTNGDPSFQKCLDSGCPPPVELKNSIILGNMFTNGKSIRRKCVKGYRTAVKDQDASTCLSDGTWSNVYSNCYPDALFGEGFFEVNGISYKFSNTLSLNWDDANNYCLDLDGNLAKIESQQEQAILEDIIRKNYNQICYWIGGRRVDNVLKWWDGEELFIGYQNMNPGEPDSDGDCLDLLIYFDYRWNDAPCHAACNFICKII